MNRICTVLVVEDDPHISDLIIFLLKEAGYHTRAAHSAAQALQMLEQEDLDLVILDWMLPDTPGDQVCHAIKSRPNKSFLPILMLTARSGLADRVAGLDAGADDFLTKPFHSDELMARVRALWRVRVSELERLQMIGELRQAYEQLGNTQAQLVQTSRLAALGELVAGVAHELNNPLGIILGNAELLPRLADAEDQRAVEQIIAGAHRARRIVQSLATFARQGKMEEDWYKPRDLIERVLDLKRVDLRNRGIDLRVEYEVQLPMLWADGAQIQHVLLNILINAEYALTLHNHESPTIMIQVAQQCAPVGPPPLINGQAAAPYGDGPLMVVVDIADNGIGMEAHVAQKIFQPFMTTKPIGQGTGLGLAISYGIIAQHGGTLQFTTRPGIGTTFRVALPVVRPGAPPRPEPSPQQKAHVHGSILVIDDEPYILDFIERLLGRHGWNVEIVQRAEAALKRMSDHPFDIVLCDLKMPDMDGITFYHELQSRNLTPPPHLVIMTGDTSSESTASFLDESDLPVLHKPFTSQELLALLAVQT
jgi:DNA-binding response OmpR family regulator